MSSQTEQGAHHRGASRQQRGLALAPRSGDGEPVESVIAIDAALAPLLPRMRQLLDEHIRFLRAELDQRAFEAVRSNACAVHKLARRFELRRIAELCRKLEVVSCPELADEAHRCLSQLEAFVSRCKFVCRTAQATPSPAAA